MIVGRAKQIGELRERIGAILSGQGGANTLFVAGEAGIGKTTLLGALKEKLLSSPNPPVIFTADCSTPLAGHDIGEVEALAPWMEIVADLSGEEGENRFKGRTLVGKLALAWVRCIPVVGDVLESAADTAMLLNREKRKKEGKERGPVNAGSQEQMFRQCMNLLAAVADQHPVVVIIDDAHWADTSSINLLFSAARELQEKPIAFVVAYRPDEAAASRGGEGHPILRIVGELERYSLAVQIDLPLLDGEQLEALLRSRYSGYRPDPSFERWLAEVSDGNALFITQFLNTLEEDGRIDPIAGRLLKDFRDVEIPDSAYAVVRERIRRLGEDTRELLRYASVEGEVFTVMMLQRVTERNRLTLLTTLRKIEETHKVIVNLGKQHIYAQETTAYRFAHTLLHKAMYDGLGEEEREVLHELMLEVLLQERDATKAAGESATLFAPRIVTHAGVLKKYLLAAEAAMEGAEGSWEELAADETLRQIEQALEYVALAGKRNPAADDTNDLEIRAYRTRGTIRRYRGDYEASLEDVRRALELARRSGKREHEIAAMIDEASTFRQLGGYAEGERLAREALGMAEEIGYERGKAGAFNTIGTILYAVGSRDEAAAHYLKAADILKELGEASAQAQTLSNLGNVFHALGDLEEATRCYERSLNLAAEADNMVSYGVALLHLGNMENTRENLKRAADYYRQSMEIGARIGYRELQSHSMTNLGIVARKGGDLVESREWLTEAERFSRSWGRTLFLADLDVEFGLLEKAVAERTSGRERAGARERAINRFGRALNAYRTMNHERAAEVEKELEELDENAKGEWHKAPDEEHGAQES